MITKELVKQYWDDEPCGTRGNPYPVGSLAYYDEITWRRNKLEPFIAEYAQYSRWKDKKVLEIGCGVGSDLIRFAQAGADIRGIDLSPRSVFLAKERLELYKCSGKVDEGDAENLPYNDGICDFVFSWGCLHHTPNLKKAISEIYRVTKSGGEICVMLYHRHSIVASQMYLLFGLLKGKPHRGVESILANYHESLGTKAYTVAEVKRMFSAFRNLRINTRITSYDLRYGRDRYLPFGIGKFIPQCFGWNIIVRGQKL